MDQGVLNHVLNGKILQISPRYNLYAALYDFSYENLIRYRKPNFFYTKEEIQTAKEHAAVVHFTSSFLSLRPWVAGSRHPYAEQWLQIKKQSPWRGATAPAGLQERLEKGIRKILSYNAAPLFRMAFRFIAFRFVAQASIKNFNCNIFSVKLIGKAKCLVSR